MTRVFACSCSKKRIGKQLGSSTGRALWIDACFGQDKGPAATPRGLFTLKCNQGAATVPRGSLCAPQHSNATSAFGPWRHRRSERPSAWTADWMKHRMVEAFTIERGFPTSASARQSSKARGPGSPPPTPSRKLSGKASGPRERLGQMGPRRGALPYEVSRMEEALSWPGLVLGNGHAAEGKALLAWAFCVAYGKPLRQLIRKRGWSRSSVDGGSARIAEHLNKRTVAVR